MTPSLPPNLDQQEPALRRPRILSPRQQAEYLELARVGAPTTIACQRVGVSFEDVLETQSKDVAFEDRLAVAKLMLAGNVEAAMYKSAMSGSVFAQYQFLRQCRPTRPECDPCEGLSTDELKDLVTAAAHSWEKEEQEAMNQQLLDNGTPNDTHPIPNDKSQMTNDK